MLFTGVNVSRFSLLFSLFLDMSCACLFRYRTLQWKKTNFIRSKPSLVRYDNIYVVLQRTYSYKGVWIYLDFPRKYI